MGEWVYELRRQAAYVEGRIEGSNGRRLAIRPDERLLLIRALLKDEEREALRLLIVGHEGSADRAVLALSKLLGGIEHDDAI